VKTSEPGQALAGGGTRPDPSGSDTTGPELRQLILRTLQVHGITTIRALSHMVGVPLHVARRELTLLRAFGWVVPVRGYQLTSTGRASIAKPDRREGSFKPGGVA
jgi:hypothetical protein